MVNEKSLKNLRPAKPGEVRNPSGRPAGILTRDEIANCIDAALCLHTGKKKKQEALTAYILEGIKLGAIKHNDLLARRLDCIPKNVEVTGPEGGPVSIILDA